MEKYQRRKKQMRRTEAGPCDGWAAERVSSKDEFQSLDFRFGLRKGIMQKLPGSPRLPDAGVDI